MDEDIDDFIITQRPFSGPNSSDESLDFSEIEDFICSECGKSFSNRGNLKRHVNQLHPEAPGPPSKSLEFKCSACPRQFSSEKNLKYHVSVTHGNHEVKLHSCPKCKQHFPKKDMLHHLTTQHNVCTEEKALFFATSDEFKEWKSEFEKETTSKFIKRSVKKTTNGVTYYFICHRSGHYSCKGKGKRHLKQKGSNKIGGFCPAKISAFENSSGSVNVKYISTHVGHDLDDLGRLTLTEEENKMIAAKILQEMSQKIKSSNQDLEMRRIKIIQDLTKLVLSATDSEQISFLEKHKKYMETTIDVMKNVSEKGSNKIETPNVAANKNIIPQRRKRPNIDSTSKTTENAFHLKKKRKISKPAISSEDLQKTSLDLLLSIR